MYMSLGSSSINPLFFPVISLSWYQSGGGRRGTLVHGKLLQDEGGACLQERGEVPRETEMAPDTLEALGEATDDVEYQRTVADRFSKVSEGVGHVLEAAAVLRDGQVP
jgi:hypothetical protein